MFQWESNLAPQKCVVSLTASFKQNHFTNFQTNFLDNTEHISAL